MQFDVLLRAATNTMITVVSPSGEPASGVEVGLESPGAQLQLLNGGFSRGIWLDKEAVLRTDSGGRFQLTSDEAITRVIAVGSNGYAEALPAALAANPLIRLQPWGQIEGVVLNNGRPAAVMALSLHSLQTTLGSLPFAFPGVRADTDAQGRFVFTNVPPGWNELTDFESLKGVYGTGIQYWGGRRLEQVEVRPGDKSTLVIRDHSN